MKVLAGVSERLTRLAALNIASRALQHWGRSCRVRQICLRVLGLPGRAVLRQALRHWAEATKHLRPVPDPEPEPALEPEAESRAPLPVPTVLTVSPARKVRGSRVCRCVRCVGRMSHDPKGASGDPPTTRVSSSRSSSRMIYGRELDSSIVVTPSLCTMDEHFVRRLDAWKTMEEEYEERKTAIRNNRYRGLRPKKAAL